MEGEVKGIICITLDCMVHSRMNGYIVLVVMDECTAKGYTLQTHVHKKTKYHGVTSQFVAISGVKKDASVRIQGHFWTQLNGILWGIIQVIVS